MVARRAGQTVGKANPVAVDLFCGSGAVTAALRRHGYRVALAIDNDPVACRTFKLNHYRTRMICGDIRDVDPASHPKLRNLGPIDLLVVCAPCQPFSSQNKNRSGYDSRAGLILEAVRFAAALSPRIVLFENVSGLAAPDNEALLRRLRQEFAAEGYLLGEPRRIDAADLGVPQRRVRCVMIAAKHPASLALFGSGALPYESRTVRDTIGHLPPLRTGERSEDPLHFARNHKPIVLERLKHIPVGGSRRDLPPHLVLDCHRGRTKSFSDVYGRMRWDDVAPTLTTGCNDLTKGRYAHPEQDRAITLREAALLQTFPANYRFRGNSEQIARQIGNAVPVKMVEAIVPLLSPVESDVA